MVTRIVLAAAVVMFVFGTSAAAQFGTSSMSGVVRDETGNGVPGAVVTVAHPVEPVVRVSITDQQGRYAVPGLEPDIEYETDISHPQFRKETVRARAGAGMTVEIKPRRSCLFGRRRASRDERR